jgi:hypothetical protein
LGTSTAIPNCRQSVSMLSLRFIAVNIRPMLLIILLKEAAGKYQFNVLLLKSQVQQLLVVTAVGSLTPYTSNEQAVHCTIKF